MAKINPFACCRLLICALLLVPLAPGCSRKRIEELKKEKLFAVPIGTGLEEIGVQREKDGRFIGPTTVLFNNGFFYVVDHVNQKLLKVTTPGDIILTLSKGEASDEPAEENVLRLKERKNYPFNMLGQIAVDSENNIFVEDRVLESGPEETEIDVFSSSSGVKDGGAEMYVSRILKFDRLGGMLFSLGKEGRGTEPFYNIYKMDVDNDGDLIVLTAEEEWEKWTYYKFDPDGNLMLFQVISTEQIFKLKDTVNTGFFILDLFPVRNNNDLAFWVSLYDTSRDTASIKKEEEVWGEEIEIENAESMKGNDEKSQRASQRDLLHYRLLFYNLDTGTVGKSYKWENRTDADDAPTEELMGIDGKANGFLWRYVDSTKAIVSIFRANGAQVARRSFVMEDDGLWADVKVAEDGSVTGVKVGSSDVSFYRWRSDELINRKPQKVSLKEFVRGKVEEFRNANR